MLTGVLFIEACSAVLPEHLADTSPKLPVEAPCRLWVVLQPYVLGMPLYAQHILEAFMLDDFRNLAVAAGCHAPEAQGQWFENAHVLFHLEGLPARPSGTMGGRLAQKSGLLATRTRGSRRRPKLLLPR